MQTGSTSSDKIFFQTMCNLITSVKSTPLLHLVLSSGKTCLRMRSTRCSPDAVHALWFIFRHILRTPGSVHVTPLLLSRHWLPADQRIEYTLLLLCVRVISDQLPSTTLTCLIHIYTASRQLRSSANPRVFRQTILSHNVQWSAVFLSRAVSVMLPLSGFFSNLP